MPQVSASLLAADYTRLGEEVQRAARAGANVFIAGSALFGSPQIEELVVKLKALPGPSQAR